MKKIGLLFVILGFGCWIGLGSIKPAPLMVRAEPDQQQVDNDETKATVVIEKVENGTIEATVLEGNEGDICQLNIKADLFYVVESVTVNGVALIEDENIRGLYSFVLTRGENIVATKIVVDSSLLGELSSIYEQAKNKDWTNLFTVENVLHLIKWVFDCGILIAIIRYYIRDKRLATKLENKLKKTIQEILPDVTKEIVIKTVKDVLEPIFAQLKADNIDIRDAMSVLTKCIALMQENTPESRVAVMNLLSELNLSDKKTIDEIKAYIDKTIKEHLDTINEVISSMNAIDESANKIMNEEEQALPITDVGDGTSI